jgi:hypothetical protein
MAAAQHLQAGVKKFGGGGRLGRPEIERFQQFDAWPFGCI